MTRRRFDLIVFDWDGTLFDSTRLIARCIQSACADVGTAVPTDHDASYVIGLGLGDALRHAAPALPPERYGEVARELAKDGIASVLNLGPNEDALASRVESTSNNSTGADKTLMTGYIWYNGAPGDTAAADKVATTASLSSGTLDGNGVLFTGLTGAAYDVVDGYWIDCGESVAMLFRAGQLVAEHGANRPA